MAQFEVRVNDKKFNARYSRLMRKFPNVVDASVRQAAFFGEREYKRISPVRTGTLRRGFRTRRKAMGIWQILNRVVYALRVDQGGPEIHTFIRPKKKQALRWIGPDGVERFSKGHAGKVGRFAGHKMTDRLLPKISRRLVRALLVNLGKVRREAGFRGTVRATA